MADNRRKRILPALILFYLVIVLLQSSLKLIWADELITFYIARQPGFHGIWAALRAGADPNPPLMHLLVQASTSLFGVNALALRLPAILSVLLAILAIWWMLRRWVLPVFALVGALAFMATRGFDYAYDARSYAPMMGFAMASLALWIFAADLAGRARLAALAAMTLALAAGLSSNYYCVLAFFPIAAGELVATLQSRRIRWDLWLALALAALPLLAFLPLIRHNLAEFGPHAWNRPQPGMLLVSYIELVEGIFWPILALALWNLNRLVIPGEVLRALCAGRSPSTPTSLNSPQPHPLSRQTPCPARQKPPLCPLPSSVFSVIRSRPRLSRSSPTPLPAPNKPPSSPSSSIPSSASPSPSAAAP